MEANDSDTAERVSLMTLHAAKGLEFGTVFLPGWEEGLLPNQRALDESGRAGLEEERRLAHVGLTRARRRAKIYFASNRRIHGMWNSTLPSRFIDDLPEAHVEVLEAPANFSHGGGYGGGSRFDRMSSFGGSTYQTPGWQRAQAHRGAGGGFEESPRGGRRGPMLIEGELVAKSTGQSGFSTGGRVLHMKFGPGTVAAVDGNKLTVDFDKAGRKMVLDSFVEAAG
jgi:DNA helicase-2/ATP-dependent DNA helicase PcrA